MASLFVKWRIPHGRRPGHPVVSECPSRFSQVFSHSHKIHLADHDASLPNMSVQSQWCNKKTGNWHETLFVGNEKCEESWYAAPIDLTFAVHSCTGGVRLKECRFRKCDSSSAVEDARPPLATINKLVKVKAMLRGNEVSTAKKWKMKQ
jgi:hypothetical protein